MAYADVLAKNRLEIIGMFARNFSRGVNGKDEYAAFEYIFLLFAKETG